MRYVIPALALVTGCQQPAPITYVTHEGDTIVYEVPAPDTTVETNDTGSEYPNRPEVTTSPEKLEINVFGKDGNHYWLAVTEDQQLQANLDWQNGIWGYGRPYTVANNNGTHTDDLVAVNMDGDSASFTQTEFWLTGQSTGTTWDATTIPNLRLDMDEFVEGQRVGGEEHLWFHNGQASSIFHETLALQIFNQLGYPTPRTSYAWVESTVWGAGISIPYTLLETYKQDWCDHNADLLGGGCVNMWEGFGDVTASNLGTIPGGCQLGSCNNNRLTEMAGVVEGALYQPDFKAATAAYIHWPSIHKAQCLSWILGIGDDHFHSGNNTVLVERSDGLFTVEPYSTDLSANLWWPFTLYANSSLAVGCQMDASCWADAISVCETTIDQFQALDPADLVDDLNERLEDLGMLRPGDEQRYADLRSWYAARAAEGTLEAELDMYRAPQILDDPCSVDTGVVNDTGYYAPPPGGGGYGGGGYYGCY